MTIFNFGVTAVAKKNSKRKPTRTIVTKTNSAKLQLAISILSIDFWNIKQIIKLINQQDVSALHYDVMDGTFVSNISFGNNILTAISRHCTKPIDVHLMVNDPAIQYFKYYREATTVFFHFESVYYREIHNLLLDIRMKSRRAGIAVSPKTNIEQIFEFCTNCDEVLIMGVVPGKGGQKFLPQTLQKISILKAFLIREKLTKQVTIAVDGGITLKVAKQCYLRGAKKLIIGSSFFSCTDPTLYIHKLHALGRENVS